MSTFIQLCWIVSSFVRTMQHSYIVKLSRFSWNLWRSINAFNLNIFLLQVLKTRNTDRLLRVAFTPFFSSNPLTCQNFGVIGGNSLLAVPGVWKCFLSNVPWNPSWMQDKREGCCLYGYPIWHPGVPWYCWPEHICSTIKIPCFYLLLIIHHISSIQRSNPIPLVLKRWASCAFFLKSRR